MQDAIVAKRGIALPLALAILSALPASWMIVALESTAIAVLALSATRRRLQRIADTTR